MKDGKLIFFKFSSKYYRHRVPLLRRKIAYVRFCFRFVVVKLPTITMKSNVSVFINLLVLDLGSRGPSTVTLMALEYVAIWCGIELIWIVNENDFPGNESEI